MNHFKVCANLVLVTNASKQVVEKAVATLKSKVNYEKDIHNLGEFLIKQGYKASWDNYQDMEVIEL